MGLCRFIERIKRLYSKSEEQQPVSSPQFLSLHKDALSEVSNLVSGLGMSFNDEVCKGIIDIVNLVADYHEEGIPLFPEILIIDSPKYFKTLSCHQVMLCKDGLTRQQFSQIVKLCAPLAIDGWSIYILILDSEEGDPATIEYGLVTAEIRDLSLSLYSQTMEVGSFDYSALFIRNVGNKTVEVRSSSQKILVASSLSEEASLPEESVKGLVDIIINGDGYRESKNFLSKTILHALNEGHGNLIAVISEQDASRDEFFSSFHGGVRLTPPINYLQLVEEAKSFPNAETSSKLRLFTSLLMSMLNFDGITIFTNTGKICGYHFIVNNNAVVDENVTGGSRTRAFEALRRIDGVLACFMKSQDGKTKFYRR